ncbi:TPA_asm: RNA-directed RNA polymerase, partial [ssRNA phage Gephyllon.2_11]
MTADSDKDAKAAKKFLHSNSLCRNWVLNTQHSGDEVLIGCLRREVDDFLHPSGEPLVGSIEEIFNLGRSGPGASLGANGVDFYSKFFSSKLTATSFEVYYQYAELCAKHPIWGNAEFNRLLAYGLPDIVLESRVTFVPKDLTQTRSICTEPSVNMFFQLGLGEILTSRLRSHFGVSLSRQPQQNVKLARKGSRDGSVVTIDLESASDSLSLNLCGYLFPGWFNDLLDMYRTPATVMQGQRVELGMVSTMGNGFTFPLQTMLFSCVVRAVASSMGVRLGRASSRNPQWGVFGDDIICPTEMSDRVVRLLRLIGFRVNSEKSYTERWGRFRESCGGDYYYGRNVRGVYVKHLSTPQSRYVAINLLNEWSARWQIPLPRAVGYLQDSVRHLAVPISAPIDSGIRLPQNLLLNRYGIWASSSRDRFLYRYWQAWVPSIRVREDRLDLPRGIRLRGRVYNPSGLYFAFLGGFILDSRIPIALKQGERPRYRMKTAVAPFWGPTVEQVRSHAPGFWGWFETIVPLN